MKLEQHPGLREYVSELTRKLDEISGLSKQEYYDFFYHYIIVDEFCRKEKCLAIRVPGGTVGGIWFDDNNVVTKIVIDTDYVIKTYPEDIKKYVESYIGQIIEF